MLINEKKLSITLYAVKITSKISHYLSNVMYLYSISMNLDIYDTFKN